MHRLLIFILLVPFVSPAQTIKARQYKPGKTSKYKLTTEVYRNDKFSGKTISIAELKVVRDTGFLSDEIHWLGKVSVTGKDTVSLDSIARKIPPYRISLSPKGKVLLPKLTSPEMVGDITDLNTFFVAVAPALNMQKLTLQKPVHTNTELRKGNFADSMVILFGTDCIEVTQSLVEANKNYAIIKTEFIPPLSPCLKPLLDTMAGKTFDRPHNFQMIQKGAGDKVNVFWGVESFTILTKIDNRNGQIAEATMTNILNLRMRYNASQDLNTYAAEMPLIIKRDLKLELVKE